MPLLADVIDTMAAALGNDAEINLVAHSMGGLIARSYLESGQYANRPGFAQVKRLITMGTPHRGSPMALSGALGHERRLFLNAEQVKQLTNDPNFPSLYQLLPPQHEPFAWDRDDKKRFEPVDIYEAALSKTLGLVTANLDSASRFHGTLDMARKPDGVRYFSFVGTREVTTSSVQIWKNSPATAQPVTKIDREDGGDGTVPVWSASQTGIQMEPVPGEHGGLYKSQALQRVLGVLLGRPGILAAVGPTPEIWVQYKVVEPGDTNKVTVEFPAHTTAVKAELRVSRRFDAKGTAVPAPAVIQQFSIDYAGPAIDHLAVLIDAPQFPGVYEIEYVPQGAATAVATTAVATTELFVQAP